MNREVQTYLENQTPIARDVLIQFREWVYEIAPDCEERFSYGMPTYRKGKNIMHFASAKKHIGIYPGPKAIEYFAEQLKCFKTSKGTIKVPLNQLDLMTKSLFQSILAYNVQQLEKN